MIAVLPPWRYQLARVEAKFHVQVKVLHVEAVAATPAQVRVDAEVVRVFRGQPSLQPGDRVHFTVSVLQGDEPWDRIPVGGTLWTNYPALQATRFLEVFLDGAPPACEIRLWQHALLDAPTDQPTMHISAPVVARPVAWLWRVLGFRGPCCEGDPPGMETS